MDEDNFHVECSDEEVEKAFTVTPNGIEPCPSEIVRLYETVAKDGSAPIIWKWDLGRRPPTPSQSDSESEKEEEESKVDTSGFDFDEEITNVRITPRRTGTSGLKGSAKKKTTNFQHILASVRRRQKLEMSEQKGGGRKDKK